MLIHYNPSVRNQRFLTPPLTQGRLRALSAGDLYLNQSAVAILLTQHRLFDLAGGVSGDLVEDDLLGTLIPGQCQAEAVDLFFGAGSDILILSVAQYFCELCAVLGPVDSEGEEFLRLVLNSLYFLTENTEVLCSWVLL